MPAHNRDHYSGSYQAEAKRVRRAAYEDPSTRCWQCKRTLAEHQRKWQAGHRDDAQPGGVLLAECEQCNTSRGATVGNKRRIGLVPTRRW